MRPHKKKREKKGEKGKKGKEGKKGKKRKKRGKKGKKRKGKKKKNGSYAPIFQKKKDRDSVLPTPSLFLHQIQLQTSCSFQVRRSTISIPPFNAPRFNNKSTVYLPRKLSKVQLAFDEDSFEDLRKRLGYKRVDYDEDEILKQFLDQDGNFEWDSNVDECTKSDVWGKILRDPNTWGTNHLKPPKGISESEFIDQNKWAIISGVAGTGKSTFVSSLATQLKEKEPHHWVITINLVDHSDALGQSGDMGFLANLPEIVGESSFARSLLRHRLATGNRIALVLDGFDEIDGQRQEATTEMMQSISKLASKSIRLYVTTRPYLKEKLQDKLYEYAYDLENFTKTDQITYLTSFCRTNVQTEEDKEISCSKKIEDFIDRVYRNLNDREQEFMGIPLHCKMLAEHAAEHESILTSQNFNLTSFFESFMEEKRQLYRNEKAKENNSNQYMTDSIDDKLQKIESDLTKLAIETLVVDKENAGLLWPTPFQSRDQRIKEEKKTIDDGIKFGILDKNGENSKAQFLHRTYAEYLFAKFLYEGFHVGDGQHNGLLDSEPVRKIIANEILVKEQYNGVRLFLDSMLIKIMDSNEWRQIQETGTTGILPERLKQISQDISTSGYIGAIHNKNSNLFVLMFDCLQGSANQTKIQEIIGGVFQKGRIMMHDEQSHKVFKRLITNCDIITNERIVNDIILDTMKYDFSRVDTSEKSMEMKKVLELFLKFMYEAGQKGKLESFLASRNGAVAYDFEAHFLHYLICQNGYENCLQQFLEMYTLLSKDELLVNLLEKVFKRYEDWSEDESERNIQTILVGKIENVLILLQTRSEVLARISHVILKRDPRAFANFYKPEHLQKEEEKKDESLKSLLLDRDSARMTRLHRAIYYGETGVVINILHLWFDQIKKANPEAKEAIEKVLATDVYGFTPCYVAYALKQKELYIKILEFLKEVLGDDDLKKYLMDKKGFLQVALLEALSFEEIDMLEMILSGIKTVFGQGVLLEDVLKSKHNKRYMEFLSHRKKECFETIAKVLVDEHGNVDYEKLNEIVFQQPDYVVDVLKHAATSEIREKMIFADGGIGGWLSKRFLPMQRRFRELARLMRIIELGDEGRQQFVDFGISFVDGEYSARKRSERLCGSDIEELFDCILRVVGKEALEEVVLHKNCNAIIETIEAHPDRYMIDVVDLVLEHLPRNETITHRFRELKRKIK